MKSQYLGAMGHIAIRTNYIKRAVYFLEQKGMTFNWDEAKYDAKGNLVAVYMNEEMGGFAIHLLQKK